MIRVVFHKAGQVHRDDVADNSNLVVRAGIKRFPFPHLTYGCGMGKCGRCACRVLAGGGHIPEPNWKEERVLGPRLRDGYRLVCQLWLTHDIELAQDADPIARPVQPVPNRAT